MKRFTGIDTESLKYLIWEETIFKQKARTPPTSLNKTTDELWAQPLSVMKLHLFSTEKKHIMKYTHLYKIKRSLRKQANVLTKEKKKSPKDDHQPTQIQGPRISFDSCYPKKKQRTASVLKIRTVYV